MGKGSYQLLIRESFWIVFASSKPIIMIPNLDLVHKMPNFRMQLEIQKSGDNLSLEGSNDWLMWFDKITIKGVWFALSTKFITHPVFT